MYKTTWMHPPSKHWHLLGYVIVRSRNRKDVRITWAMRGTVACSTEHRLVRSVMNIYQDPNKRTKLQECLSTRLLDFPSADVNVEQRWDALKSATHKACTETIGHTSREHQDWFNENDEEIQDLLERNRKTFCMSQNDITSHQKWKEQQHIKAETQEKIRDIKTSSGKRKPKRSKALLTNMICGTSSKR